MIDLKELMQQYPIWLRTIMNETPRVLLSQKISLHRNLAKFPFPKKASLTEKERIFTLVKDTVTEQTLLGDSPIEIDIQHINDIAKTLLFERDYISLSMIQENGTRGLITDFSTPYAIAINGENHIEIFAVTTQKDTTAQWEKLDTIDNKLGAELPYAFNDRFGFLLAHSDESGTGLSVQMTFHLPGLVLTGSLDHVFNAATQIGIHVEGKFRNGSESWGSLFVLTAGAFAGSNESEIIAQCESLMHSIVEQELEARNALFSQAAKEMEDKVWRSFGILRFARMLSIEQLLNITSVIRLGIEQGIFQDVLSLEELNTIVVKTLQGSVALHTEDNEQVSPDILEICRADMVRALLDKKEAL